MSKPREWWIIDHWLNGRDVERITVDEDPGPTIHDGRGMGRDVFHVIEKSAYDALLTQAEAMAKALEKIEDVAKMHVETFKMAPLQTGTQTIRNWMPILTALKAWQKFKEQK